MYVHVYKDIHCMYMYTIQCRCTYVHFEVCNSLHVASKQKQYLGIWRNYRTPVEACDSGDAEKAKEANNKEKVYNIHAKSNFHWRKGLM